jgi:ribosomal subunit interface protein
MQLPLQVTYRDLAPSQAVTAKIREKADKLERFYDRITGCRVVVEASHAHRHKGRRFHVHISLTVPDGELVVSRDHHDRPDHTDLYVAIRDAFDAAGRKLKAYARRRRGDVKAHDAQSNGRVSGIASERGDDAIETDDGREIRPHRNGLPNADALHVEIEVRFVEESGMRAGTVRTVGRRREA